MSARGALLAAAILVASASVFAGDLVPGGIPSTIRKSVTFAPSATGNVTIDGRTTPATQTNGELRVNVTSATGAVVGVKCDYAQTADVDSQACYVGQFSSGTALTGNNVRAPYRSQAFGVTSDAATSLACGYYLVSAAGANTGTRYGYCGNASYDAFLYAKSGAWQYVDYALSIQGVNSAGAGESLTLAPAAAVASSGGAGGSILLNPSAGDGAGASGSVTATFPAGGQLVADCNTTDSTATTGCISSNWGTSTANSSAYYCTADLNADVSNTSCYFGQQAVATALTGTAGRAVYMARPRGNASDASTTFNYAFYTLSPITASGGRDIGYHVGSGWDYAFTSQSGNWAAGNYPLTIETLNDNGGASDNMTLKIADAATSGAAGSFNITGGAGAGSGNGTTITLTPGAGGGGGGSAGTVAIVGAATVSSTLGVTGALTAPSIVGLNSALSDTTSIATANNASTLGINIPVASPDAGEHAIQLMIDANNLLAVTATGDGAGSITASKVIVGAAIDFNSNAASELNSISAADNNAAMALNIPVTGADVATHTMSAQLDGTPWLSAVATGDGGGGVGGATIVLGTASGADTINIGTTTTNVVLNGATWRNLVGTVTTSDATVTTAATFDPVNSTMLSIECAIVGRKDGTDSAGYTRIATFNDSAGTLTIVGSVSTPHTAETAGASAWDATIDADSGSVRVRVTGAAATTISWSVFCTMARGPM